jgi:hypothetical protein
VPQGFAEEYLCAAAPTAPPLLLELLEAFLNAQL